MLELYPTIKRRLLGFFLQAAVAPFGFAVGVRQFAQEFVGGLRIGFVAMQARMKESTAEHQEFVASILAGNSAQAEQQMRDHLNGVRQELERLLVNVVLPFVDSGV